MGTILRGTLWGMKIPGRPEEEEEEEPGVQTRHVGVFRCHVIPHDPRRDTTTEVGWIEPGRKLGPAELNGWVARAEARDRALGLNIVRRAVDDRGVRTFTRHFGTVVEIR